MKRAFHGRIVGKELRLRGSKNGSIFLLEILFLAIVEEGMSLRILLSLFFVATACLQGQIGEIRSWTSSDGRLLKGKLLEADEKKIVVERNGRPVTIRIDLLSEEDRKFVADLVKKLSKEAALAAQDSLRSEGFSTGPYAEYVKGEWLLGDPEKGLVHQLFIGKEVKKKKAGPVVPLFVHLHGAGGRADSVKPGRVEIAAQTITARDWYEDHPCVVLVPTCPPDPMAWGKEQIQSRLEALIDDLVKNLPIDRKRIYLSGYSMGGQGIGKLIERRPEMYAAALFADGGPKESWVGKTKTAMWSYYSGERDSSNTENLKEKFKEDGVEFRTTILKNATHNQIHWKLSKDPKVWEWLVDQSQ